MLQVKFKKLHADTKLPVKGSLDAACYDVYATSVNAEYGGRVTYGLGFSTEIPKGWKAIIVPRSNLTKHNWVMSNSVGIIDSDYRGEWMVKLSSIGNVFEPLPYTLGDRIAQVYFEKVEEIEFVETESLSYTYRSEGGFGSTGVSTFPIENTSVTSATPQAITLTINENL
jgi:dUTP pyrophosphatase